jgi:phenylalanyl-tRNA synthetase beta chain
VTREIDVIEEIARRRGYDSFTTGLSAYRPGVVPGDPLLRFEDQVHRLFERWGLLEARTAAFAPASPDRVAILNPLSSEESLLRDDLAHGLLRRLEYNWARGVRTIRLYEIGTVFAPDGHGVPAEEVHVAAVFTGARTPQHWSASPQPFDLWDLKGLCAEVASLLRLTVAPVDEAAPPTPLLAPGEALRLLERDGDTAGWGGRVSSRRLDAPAWGEAVWLLEARLRVPERASDHSYTPLPAYPAVERDLALVLDRSLPAARVEEVIRRESGPTLEALRPFDLYVGEGIPEGARSVAWRLRFRHPERTLTDAEVDAVTGRVVEALRTELHVERR